MIKFLQHVQAVGVLIFFSGRGLIKPENMLRWHCLLGVFLAATYLYTGPAVAEQTEVFYNEGKY